MKDFNGDLTGNFKLAPTTTPRAQEPLAFVMTTQIKGGRWRTMPVTDARFAAYVGPDPFSPGGYRMVMDDVSTDRSFVHAAGGTVQLWGRLGTKGRGSASMAQVSFRDLDLNTVVHAFNDKSAPMPGTASGNLILLRAALPPTSQPSAAEQNFFPSRPPDLVKRPTTAPSKNPLRDLIEPIYAEGDVQLHDANLADVKAFAFLYDAAKLFQNMKNPLGTGSVQFHLERGQVNVERMRYFNRGTEIRAVATVSKIWDFPNSPLDGSAFLTARPLGGAKLPLFADLDTAIGAIQQGLQLTGVKVHGTINKYKPEPVSLHEMGHEMKNFLVGDAKGNTAGAGGN